MSTRFRYEPKTPLQKVALRLKHPLKVANKDYALRLRQRERHPHSARLR